MPRVGAGGRDATQTVRLQDCPATPSLARDSSLAKARQRHVLPGSHAFAQPRPRGSGLKYLPDE